MPEESAHPELIPAIKAFGARVKMIRETQGRRQEEVAAAIGLSQQSLSAIENGRSSPRLSTILRLAEVLRTPASAIFDFDAAGPPESEHQRAVRDLLRLLREQPPEVVRTLTQQAKPLIALVGRTSGRP